jgi:hypothetical protein
MRRRGRKFPFFSGVPAGAIGALPLPAPTLTFRGNAQNTVDGTSWTTGSFAIGDASPARWVIVLVYSSGSPSAVACSASGGALTQLFSADAGRIKAYIGQVPAGTTSTFTVTSGASLFNGMAVYTVENLASSAVRASAVWTATVGGALDVDVLEGGFVLGFGYGNQTPTFTWTGLTKDHETLMESANDHTSASASGLSAETPRAVSVSVSAGASNSTRGFAIAMR